MSTSATERRVVICGLGAVTSQGPTAQHLWDGVRAGRVAIRPVQHLPMDGYRTRLGGEVLDREAPVLEYRRPSGAREPAIEFALRAAAEAVADAGDLLASVAPERRGIVVGTCNAGLISGREWYARRMAGEPADPELLLLMGPQAISEALAGALDFGGPCLSINTACAAGAHALGQAADLIRSGRADAVLAGGTDAFSDVLFSGFNSLESLSPAPAAPYSGDRQGLSLGEGAGMLLLLAADLVPEGAARAELLGYGTSADGYHATAPHPEGEGAARAIRAALAAAGVDADEVGYVNTHGTGTAKNDVAETRANRRALGGAAHRAALSSTKSMIGHLLGAAGAVEGIVTVRALQEQIAPPTAGYTVPDAECDLDYVPNAARAMTTDVALSNNFAFGGANASLVLARPGRLAKPPVPVAERVVITGLGTLTSAGCDPEALWDAFRTGRRCASDEDGVLVGRVPLDVRSAMPPRERRRLDRLGLLSVVAARSALADGGLSIDEGNRHAVGVVVGTGAGPMESIESFTRGILEEGPAAANPATFPNTVYNAAGGQVAMHLGAVGPASTVTTGHAAGAAALCTAAEIVAGGRADAVLAVAVDALTDAVIDGYRALGLLSGDFALAEAGVALLVESRSSALARGATIYGELRSHAVTCDALGVGGIDPAGVAAERAMRLALNGTPNARVWASACGHAVADAAEASAISRVFGSSVRVDAPKRLLAEPIGAGGALNAALALLAFRHGEREPALVNSGSLGGTHVSLLLTPHD
ncbi:beta-ketoacyl-[acyl-carrier-protein] synthase family protein [Solirubrobacter ginsenosidimutans]|uniref:Beta-ketoacyl-[acyl-carrier-protein] synthase family protein n=1 Tax=Solirubrobacter ginsenosidimutans TaxID=490573 RepID=A0A9X3N4H0_9ACTN|nr:beta-ketoacyl-[acyl-carrier-protein] synthase family protein [Solirubrobacter ginsenosidimutans]MDA0166507.1 beta-ketoacyl-[acyl-carrier-protein] synthase family protein [Solirubrobacter ginsenosidimutans]